ncbi:hypothetical protein [Streptomyces sp. NPDC050263]|uniref:hypothetical protein n=1 Tax=Streptomyces sp. NPDC050263 TaxID=3155037 RepID=UPI003430789D
MTNGTAPPPEGPQDPGMTIRVYTVARDGRITSDRGTRTLTYEGPPVLAELGTTGYPPCQCSRHRVAGAR